MRSVMQRWRGSLVAALRLPMINTWRPRTTMSRHRDLRRATEMPAKPKEPTRLMCVKCNRFKDRFEFPDTGFEVCATCAPRSQRDRDVADFARTTAFEQGRRR